MLPYYPYTLYPSVQSTRNYSATSELWNIFSNHSSDLRAEKNRVEDSIRSWYQNIYDVIRQYHINQLKAVQQHFSELENKIQTVREQCSKSAQELIYANDERSINELIEKCKKLKFSMGETSFREGTISFVEYLPAKLGANEPKQPSTESDTKMIQLVTNATINNSCTSENQVLLSSPSNNQILTRTNSAVENKTSEITVEVHRDHEQQKPIQTATKSIEPNFEALFECCQICYMLFPKHLSAQDRQDHRSAHY